MSKRLCVCVCAWMLMVAFSRCLATLLPLLMRAKTCFLLSLSLPPSLSLSLIYARSLRTSPAVTSQVLLINCVAELPMHVSECVCVCLRRWAEQWQGLASVCVRLFVCPDLCCASLWLSLSLTTRHPVEMTPYERSQCEQTVCLPCTQNTHTKTNLCSAYTPRTFIGCEVWQR